MKGVKNMRKAITSVSIDEKLKRFLRIISVKTRISVSQLIELIINDFFKGNEDITKEFIDEIIEKYEKHSISTSKGGQNNE